MSASSDPGTLRRLLANADALLLDFDGPVCSVFASLSAETVADELRQILTVDGVPLPAGMAVAGPHELLSYTGKAAPNLIDRVEAHLTARETEAVTSAKPTVGATEFIRAWNRIERPIAIVSNNATAAIEVYLTRNQISNCVDQIVGRVAGDPSLMKPSPYLIMQACRLLAIKPSKGVFVGDSPSDVRAGRNAGMPVIGLINRLEKYESMKSLGLAAWCSQMDSLAVI